MLLYLIIREDEKEGREERDRTERANPWKFTPERDRTMILAIRKTKGTESHASNIF